MQPQRDVVRARPDRRAQAVDNRIGSHKTSSLDGARHRGDTPATPVPANPHGSVRHQLPVVLGTFTPVKVSRR
ncbi:hypothetical protein GCM10027615_31590 [Plantactinospora veratri]